MMSSRADYFLAHFLTAPVIMGVVNVTPDSFSDAGQFQTQAGVNHAAAVEHGFNLARQGAAILDIGGEASSFHRPGIGPIDPQEQIQRILPVIEGIAGRRDAVDVYSPFPQGVTGGERRTVLMSIDTRSSVVAAAALRAGADIINDISAGTDDPEMLPLAARTGCPIILMHRREEHAGQAPPTYDDVCGEVIGYLRQRSQEALAAGVKRHRILLDPGLGFGKSAADNWKLLAGIGGLVDLGYPVVLGASRKRFLAELLPPDLREAGPDGWQARDILTGDVTVLAAVRGVKIHRVHQVPLARQALEVVARMNC